MKVLCSKCSSYSFGLRRCALGYANPKTKKAYDEIVKIMTINYICNKNEFKRKQLGLIN
jgi:hypothetical protein